MSRSAVFTIAVVLLALLVAGPPWAWTQERGPGDDAGAKVEQGEHETGKAADMVILKEDLFETDPYAIHQIRPDAVVMEGALIQGNFD